MSQGTYADYDYAWKSRGWNVQNPIIPAGSVNTYTDPGLPSDVSLVRVFGKWMEFSTGRSLESVLRLSIKNDLLHVPSGSTLPAGEMKPVRFRADEGLDILLPATDDPQLTPEFIYHAKLTVRGDTREFTFALPAALVEVSIFDLTPPPTIEGVDDRTVDGGGP